MPARAVPSPEDSRAALGDTLEVLVNGIAQATGFTVVALSLFRSTDEMEFVAVAGSEEHRGDLLARAMPSRTMLQLLDTAEEWGVLRFVPEERTAVLAERMWVGTNPRPQSGADAWLPLDVLMAPLVDAGGTLRGVLSLDLPRDGRRPTPATRQRLAAYLVPAMRAILGVLERDRLDQQLRLARATRQVVRRASAELDLDGVLEAARAALIDGFAVDQATIRVWGVDEPILVADGGDVAPSLAWLARETSVRCWRTQQVAVLAESRSGPRLLTADQHRDAVAAISADGFASLALVPLGAGDECLGHAVLYRRDVRQRWSDEEVAAALDVGHDLGQAVLTARTLGREREAVRELEALSAYRRQVIATMADELRTPLTAILGHTQVLGDLVDDEALATGSVRSIARAASRLDQIVDNMVELARTRNPDTATASVPLDLRSLVVEAVEMLAVRAAAEHVEVTLDVPAQPVVVPGDRAELHRLVGNLVGNAVKYTEPGGRALVSLTTSGAEAVLTVADDGIGIGPEDREQVFEEFFRSADQRVRARSGTGLGLSIVRRVVDRHRGRIEVESVLDQGSTFRVSLPLSR